TWQDIRSSTKAKNTLIKKHAKQTGGGPASNQVLTEIDQNVLALIGSTVVEGHETVQESNVQFEWLDNSNVCNVNNDGDGERFSIICTNQEITQEPIPQNSLFPQNNYS
ncbi:uncharacterized protein, partial [Mycetomoellerius zeteki]|uniref:uncharacterized protein n=1 Tax=Mycetomoellerius zeteki TaxID=64791 RepID=UPI00084EB79F